MHRAKMPATGLACSQREIVGQGTLLSVDTSVVGEPLSVMDTRPAVCVGLGGDEIWILSSDTAAGQALASENVSDETVVCDIFEFEPRET